ncbi:MAG: hypothetical protein RLZZ283_568 [Candidatus Parcubacteria bacterium]|jgi:hypothetical protein
MERYAKKEAPARDTKNTRLERETLPSAEMLARAHIGEPPSHICSHFNPLNRRPGRWSFPKGWRPRDEGPDLPPPGPHHTKNTIEAAGLTTYFLLVSELFVKGGGIIANAGIIAAIWPFMGSFILGMIASRAISILVTPGVARVIACIGLLIAGLTAFVLPMMMISLAPVFIPALTGLGLGYYVGDKIKFT